MPNFYNFRENGLDYSFDDIFVPADMFRDGNLWTWGRGFYGPLGNAQTTNAFTPITTFAGGTNWKASSVNKSVSAIKTDGTLWVWGFNGQNELGTNDTIQRDTPVTTFAGGNDWKQVSVGLFHMAAVKTDGTLWVWGYNQEAQLGINNTSQRLTPVTTFAGGTNWKQVSISRYSGAAIKTDGTLWVWGYNQEAQLGINNTSQRLTPVTTFAGGNDWKQVDCANNYTAAIKTDGTLWTWGRGTSGELGNATITNALTPVTTFAGGNNWKRVSTNEQLAAIKTDGTLWTWGPLNYGALGNGVVSGDVSTPITTFAGGNDWKQVSCGRFHTAAIKTDGTLWTWGLNRGSNFFPLLPSASGQLGINATGDRSTPVTTFAGGTNWKQVSSGAFFTAAVTYDDPVI